MSVETCKACTTRMRHPANGWCWTQLKFEVALRAAVLSQVLGRSEGHRLLKKANLRHTMTSVSRSFTAASLHRARWLPCPASFSSIDETDIVNMPCVLATWSEDAKQYVLFVGDVRKTADTNEVLGLAPKLPVKHPGSITDLQVARIDDHIIAATSSSTGAICLLMMQLPPIPGASTADLQFVAQTSADDEEDEGAADNMLHQLPDVHSAPAASIDINTTRQALLSVSGDGSISIVQLDATAQHDEPFRASSGWSGYSQGRWVDSHTFATTGVCGGLQLWDTRRGPKPISRAPLAWGHTGCAELDKQQGPARQLLSLAVHPSRPNLAATGASGGCVALWDLRFQAAPLAHTGSRQAAGDVWELKFDPCEPLKSTSVAAVPPLLYCTSDGALCKAYAAPAAAAEHVAGWGGANAAADALAAEVLVHDSCSINSFDIEPTVGQDIMAVTDYECMLLLHRSSDM